jgi:hypothetical protein
MNPTMARSLGFTLLGLTIGLCYAALLFYSVAAPMFSVLQIGLIVAGAIIVVFCGFVGFNIAKSSEYAGWKGGMRGALFIALAPGVIPASCLGIAVLFLMVAITIPFAMWRSARLYRRMRKELESKARFASLDALRPKLEAGVGTIIEETGVKGPYHIWWTEDELPVSPPLTDEEYVGILSGEKPQAFNDYCLSAYVDVAKGKATLTSIPPRKFVLADFSRMFPRMKMVKVIRPFNEFGPHNR